MKMKACVNCRCNYMNVNVNVNDMILLLICKHSKVGKFVELCSHFLHE